MLPEKGRGGRPAVARRCFQKKAKRQQKDQSWRDAWGCCCCCRVTATPGRRQFHTLDSRLLAEHTWQRTKCFDSPRSTPRVAVSTVFGEPGPAGECVGTGRRAARSLWGGSISHGRRRDGSGRGLLSCTGGVPTHTAPSHLCLTLWLVSCQDRRSVEQWIMHSLSLQNAKCQVRIAASPASRSSRGQSEGELIQESLQYSYVFARPKREAPSKARRPVEKRAWIMPSTNNRTKWYFDNFK